jgi:5-methylcytosine-specific restriction endonuclease McrA
MRTREQIRAYQQAWEDRNREHVRAKQRAWQAAHRDQERERSRARALVPGYREKQNARSKKRYQERREEFLKWHAEYRDKNREKVRASKRAWNKANRSYVSALTAKWYAAKLNACPSWVDEQSLQAVYAEAARLTRETGIKHDVDHIDPLQSKTVCGLHVPWNMQILTRSENARKGNRL